MKNINFKFYLITTLFLCSLIVIYHSFVASDIFEAEAKIVVKGDSKGQESSISSIISGGTNLTLNSSIVKEYITSKNSLIELDKRLRLREKFSSKTIGFLQRFDPFTLDSSIENFHDYIKDYLIISVDEKSAILSVKVKCFEPELCVSAVKSLIQQSEHVVNILNERTQNNADSIYLSNLKSLQEKRDQISLELESFRLQNDIVDVQAETKLLMEKLKVLEELNIQASASLNSLRAISNNNAHLKIILEQKKGIEVQIKDIRNELSGVSNNSIVLKNTTYAKLLNEYEIYEKILSAAIASYQTHLVLIKKESVFLEQISEPVVPESAVEPKRIKDIFNSIVVLFLIQFLFFLIRIVIKEHSND